MKKTEGKITISRWTGGSEGSGVIISIEDSNSGCPIVEFNMSVEEFAHCMFGSSLQHGKIEVYDNYKNIGKFLIHKNVWVKYDSYKKSTKTLDEFAKNAVKKNEIDGWKYNHHQLGNHHYANRDNSTTRYPVSMCKYVDTIEEKELWESNRKLHNEY